MISTAIPHSMGTTFVDDGVHEKDFPCVTACPWQAFKKRGFHYNQTDFIEQTFNFDEVFITNDSNQDLNNGSLFYIEEIKSIFLGRCYMICPLKPINRQESFSYQMRNERDITGLKCHRNPMTTYWESCDK